VPSIRGTQQARFAPASPPQVRGLIRNGSRAIGGEHHAQVDHVRICAVALRAARPDSAQLAKSINEDLDQKDYHARNEHSQI
jgi:hypothetical protein